MSRPITVVFPHRPQSTGGPGSFQGRLEAALARLGWDVVYAEDGIQPDIVFVVAGTRRLLWLLKCKLRGVKVIHRLDGLVWQHRVHWPGLKMWLVHEIHNLLMWAIRRFFADAVVYQSEFIAAWWRRSYGEVRKPSHIIYNAVDLAQFVPSDSSVLQAEEVLCVEGTIAAAPLDYLANIRKRPILIYGRMTDAVRRNLTVINPMIQVMGSVPRTVMPQVFSGRRVLLCLEVNPPCPNAIVEALASGIPVVGYDTGSLKELVGDEAGIGLPYGGDPWKLESPNAQNLEAAIDRVFADYQRFSTAARRRAMAKFGIDTMTSHYIAVMLSILGEKASSTIVAKPMKDRNE